MRGQHEENCLEYVKTQFLQGKFYGISAENVRSLEQYLLSCNPNPEKSQFPDFLFNNGFVEHFQITASRLNRKGSVYQQHYAAYRRDTDKSIESFQEKVSEQSFCNQPQLKSYAFKQPPLKYEELMTSFEKIWEHHIESLKKYAGPKDIGIFFIEHPEFGVKMIEKAYEDVKEGLRYDDFRVEQEFSEYRLSRDKRALEYIYIATKIT